MKQITLLIILLTCAWCSQRITAPNGKTYNEEWFVPADCTKFTRGQLECVCDKQ